MRLNDSVVLTVILAAKVFDAVNVVTFSFCHRSVNAYVDTVGKYVHAL